MLFASLPKTLISHPHTFGPSASQPTTTPLPPSPEPASCPYLTKHIYRDTPKNSPVNFAWPKLCATTNPLLVHSGPGRSTRGSRQLRIYPKQHISAAGPPSPLHRMLPATAGCRGAPEKRERQEKTNTAFLESLFKQLDQNWTPPTTDGWLTVPIRAGWLLDGLTPVGWSVGRSVASAPAVP